MTRALYLLPLLFLALFFAYPLVTILRLSFTSTASPLVTLVSDAWFWRTLWFTTWQATLSTVLTLLVGLPVSHVFARYQFPGKTALRAIASLPFVMPVIVVAAAFTALFGPRGLLNVALQGVFGLTDGPIQLQHTLALMLMAHVFYNVSLVLRIVGSLWSNLDPRLGQAAAVLGASRTRAFAEVSLPLLAPAIGSAALLIFMFCFGAFGTVLILAGPRFATLETEIYTQATSFLNLPIAAALSLVQMVFTLALSWFYARSPAGANLALNLQSRTAHERKPTGAARAWVAVIVALVLAVFGGPPLALFVRSLGGIGSLDSSAYAALFDGGRNNAFTVPPIYAICNSLLVACAAVLLALGTGLPAAHLIARGWGGRPLRALEALFMLPLGTSAVTLGLGYIVAFSQAPLNWRASGWLMPAAHALVALPFVVRAMLPALRAIDPRLREAAGVLGAAPARVWREVDLPILLRGILVAATLAFTSSIGEFGASLLISRPDFPTMPMVIHQFLGQPGSGNYTAALAMSCLLLAVSALAFIAIERVRVDGGEF